MEPFHGESFTLLQHIEQHQPVPLYVQPVRQLSVVAVALAVQLAVVLLVHLGLGRKIAVVLLLRRRRG